MAEITKYQQLKMYLPINGYDSVKELAEDWGVHENAIRDYCRDKFKSAKLKRKTNDFIKEGERKWQEHRDSNLSKCKG